MEGDSALINYYQFLDEFGNDEVIIAMQIDTAPISNINRLKSISKITTKLNKIDGVARANSICNIPIIFKNHKILTLDSLLKTDISQKKINREFKKFKNIQTISRFAKEKDKTVFYYIQVDSLNDIELQRSGIINKVNTIFKSESDNTNVYYGGTGVIYNSINEETLNESSLFTPLSFLVAIILIIIITHRLILALTFTLSIINSNILLLGIMGLAGVKLNMTIVALIPMIMVFTVAIIMHTHAYLLRNCTTTNKTLTERIKPLYKPLIYITITTSLGFLSLVFSQMKITREYGLFAAIGAVLSLIITIIWIFVFSKQINKIERKSKQQNLIQSIVSKSVTIALQHSKITIGLFLIALIVSIWGISKIVVDTHTLNFLPKKHKTISDNIAMEKAYGGYIPFDFLIEPYSDSLTFNRLNKILMSAQKEIESLPFISSSYSIQNLNFDIKRLQARQLGYLLTTQTHDNIKEAGLKSHIINRDKSIYRLSVFGPICSVKEFSKNASQIEKLLTKHFYNLAKVSSSGYLPLYSQIIKNILHDQITSIFLVIIIITLVLIIIFKQTTLIIPAIISNILPIVLIMGTMGGLGIWLDIGTVTLAAAMFGIIVDDTIHFIYFYKRNIANSNIYDAIQTTANHTGRAIFSTTLVLICGLGILSISKVPTISNTGFLIALVAVYAFISDIFLLPALLNISQPQSKILKV